MILKIRMNLSPSPITEDSRIIIIKTEDVFVGMLVDSVSEVISLKYTEIEPPQGNSTIVTENYIRGIGKLNERLLIILNPQNIVNIV